MQAVTPSTFSATVNSLEKSFQKLTIKKDIAAYTSKDTFEEILKSELHKIQPNFTQKSLDISALTFKTCASEIMCTKEEMQSNELTFRLSASFFYETDVIYTLNILLPNNTKEHTIQFIVTHETPIQYTVGNTYEQIDCKKNNAYLFILAYKEYVCQTLLKQKLPSKPLEVLYKTISYEKNASVSTPPNRVDGYFIEGIALDPVYLLKDVSYDIYWAKIQEILSKTIRCFTCDHLAKHALKITELFITTFDQPETSPQLNDVHALIEKFKQHNELSINKLSSIALLVTQIAHQALEYVTEAEKHLSATTPLSAISSKSRAIIDGITDEKLQEVFEKKPGIDAVFQHISKQRQKVDKDNRPSLNKPKLKHQTNNHEALDTQQMQESSTHSQLQALIEEFHKNCLMYVTFARAGKSTLSFIKKNKILSSDESSVTSLKRTITTLKKRIKLINTSYDAFLSLYSKYNIPQPVIKLE